MLKNECFFIVLLLLFVFGFLLFLRSSEADKQGDKGCGLMKGPLRECGVATVTLSWVGKEVLPCIGSMYLPTLIEFSIHLVWFMVYESDNCGLENVNTYGNWSGL